MADVTVPVVQPVPNAGVVVTASSTIGSSDTGVVAKNDGSIVVLATGASGDRTITWLIRTPADDAKNPAWDASNSNPTSTVANGVERAFGPFPVALFGKTLRFTVSGNVTAKALRVDKCGTGNCPNW